MNKSILQKTDALLIITYLIVGFVPYFSAVDKIAPQYIYLTALNGISAFYILFTFNKVNFKYSVYILYSLAGLSVWSFFSIFYAVNKAEVLIENSRIVIFLFAFVNMYLIGDRSKSLIKYVPYLITVILFIELFLVYQKFYERYTLDGTYSRDMGLRAFSGNINIAAFNFLLKFPFLLYTILKIKISKVIKIIILSVFTFCLFLLGSRGANLFFSIIILIVILLPFIYKENLFISKKDLFVITLSVLVGGIINYNLFKKNATINVVKRSINFNTSSTQQRLRFYNAAIENISKKPFLGVGLGNWKIKATEYDRPFMIDYTVPYHVHNDFLEITSEIGILGFILYYGIFLWIFFLIYNSIKSREHIENKLFYLVIIALISSLGYLADSFLNFPFTRPLMQIQNLFYWVIILIIIEFNITKKQKYFLNIDQRSNALKAVLIILISSGLVYTGFISVKVYQSFVNQQFLMAAGKGSFKNYSRQYVESIPSKIPSIDAVTVPIETLKANLIFNIKEFEYNDDTLHYMIEEGRKQNPYLPYNDLTKSVLYIKQRKPDSAYIYAKKAFYQIPNHNVHFELLMDIAEAYRDSTEVNKAINSIKEKDIRDSFYEKYLEVSLNIKNNIGLTESKFLEKYNSRNPDKEIAKIYNTIFKIGKKNVEDGYYESIKGQDYFNKKEFLKAAESFSRAIEFNPIEVSYYENAANAFMQLGNDEKAIELLNEVITKLNPKTGKAEYLLGIIFLGKKQYDDGCKYLKESSQKGFDFPKAILERFCSS